MFILYDERGVLSPETASVLCVYDTPNQKEAYKEAVNDYHCGWALYDGEYLVAWQSIKNERFARWTAWGDRLMKQKKGTVIK